MKSVVGVPFFSLICTLLAFTEQDPVITRCTPSRFWVVVERTLLGQDHFLHPDEVSLGNGCPVTTIMEDVYVFNYPVTECGITSQIFFNLIIFYSDLHYNIMHRGITGKIPLMCILSTFSSGATTQSTTNNNLKKSTHALSSGTSYLGWKSINTCLFGLPWIPYFQDPCLAKSSIPSVTNVCNNMFFSPEECKYVFSGLASDSFIFILKTCFYY